MPVWGALFGHLPYSLIKHECVSLFLALDIPCEVVDRVIGSINAQREPKGNTEAFPSTII